jgi:hypothetical protein
MTKYILASIFIAFIAAQSAAVFAADTTTDFCSNVRCTANMQLIATEFQSYKKFPSEPVEMVYSGSCYMIEPGLNPEVEHHGMFLFSTNVPFNYTAGSGLHSYFAKSNPWEGLTFRDVLLEFEKRQTTLNPIIVTPTEATLTYIFPETTINHYFRTSDDEKTMIWLTEAIFTVGIKKIFCRLQRNP